MTKPLHSSALIIYTGDQSLLGSKHDLSNDLIITGFHNFLNPLMHNISEFPDLL